MQIRDCSAKLGRPGVGHVHLVHQIGVKDVMIPNVIAINVAMLQGRNLALGWEASLKLEV